MTLHSTPTVWLQTGRWRMRCPECRTVVQSPDRVDVVSLLAEHQAGDCPPSALPVEGPT